jgi:hypothetical protein
LQLPKAEVASVAISHHFTATFSLHLRNTLLHATEHIHAALGGGGPRWQPCCIRLVRFQSERDGGNFWDQDASGARPSAVGTVGGSGSDGFGLPTALDFKFCDFYLGVAVFGHLTFFRPLFYAFYRIWLDLAMLQNFKLCAIFLSTASLVLFFP